MKYGVTFFGPEDDPDERGTSWFSIGPIEDDDCVKDEFAVVIFRDYERLSVEHPEWLENAEKRAKIIAHALTLRDDVLDRLAEGFDFPESIREIAQQSPEI